MRISKWWQRLKRYRRWTYVIHHANGPQVHVISGHDPAKKTPPDPYYPNRVGHMTEEMVPHPNPTKSRHGHKVGVAYDVVLDDGTTFRQSFVEVTPVGPQAARVAVRSRLYELQPRPIKRTCRTTR